MKKMIKFAAVLMLLGISLPLNAQNAKSNLQTVEIKTSAHCQSCKDKIESGLAFEKGVKSAIVNLETKVVTIVFNPKKTNVETLKASLIKLGYSAEVVKGKCCNHSGSAGGCSGKGEEKHGDCKH